MTSYLAATREAISALGSEIAAGRRRLRWTQADLAARLGVTRQLVARIERGEPKVAVGTVLEAAVIVGVPLFGVDRNHISLVADRARAQAALLPSRVRQASVEISDDF